jgi:uncharacterized protein
MNKRIIGYDLARAYAIFGMYIVNFNFCFGNLYDQSYIGRFLSLFTGNSTSIFIMCAGIGVTLLSRRQEEINLEQKDKAKSVVLKRSWFLLFIGLLLYSWWPGDILHFYGGYMHIAAFILFLPRQYYIWMIAGILCLYHILLFLIPVETSWNLETYEYTDFWTPIGFLRNTIYNGWNSVLPWMSYFLLGMWLGGFDWTDNAKRKRLIKTALIVFILIEFIRYCIKYSEVKGSISYFFLSEYFPPFLPFLLITISFGILMIHFCLLIGEKYRAFKFITLMSNTGRMTLSHYVSHLTLGMVIVHLISDRQYTGFLNADPIDSASILLYAIGYFIFSIVWGNIWMHYFKNGPIEMLMRKLTS